MRSDDYAAHYEIFHDGGYVYPKDHVYSYSGGVTTTSLSYARDDVADPYELTVKFERVVTLRDPANLPAPYEETSTGTDYRPDPDTVDINYNLHTWSSARSIQGATFAEVVTHDTGLAWEAWLAGAVAEIDALDKSGLLVGSQSPSNLVGSLEVTEPGSWTGKGLVTRNTGHYRFRVPDTHEGSYFKITWDVADFPDDVAIDPSYFSENNTVEWTGPGIGASDDASWLTPWNEIDPPTEPGERRVVNVRFIGYHGTKYGSKPEVTGEAFDPPAP